MKDIPVQIMDNYERLSLREQTILRLRFGLEGVEEHSLEEIGLKFGLSRERVRQIEIKALDRLWNK